MTFSVCNKLERGSQDTPQSCKFVFDLSQIPKFITFLFSIGFCSDCTDLFISFSAFIITTSISGWTSLLRRQISKEGMDFHITKSTGSYVFMADNFTLETTGKLQSPSSREHVTCLCLNESVSCRSTQSIRSSNSIVSTHAAGVGRYIMGTFTLTTSIGKINLEPITLHANTTCWCVVYEHSLPHQPYFLSECERYLKVKYIKLKMHFILEWANKTSLQGEIKMGLGWHNNYI